MSAQLLAVYEPISELLRQTERIIQKALLSTSERNVARICQHILQGTGKRIRPAIVFFSYQALRPNSEVPESVCKIAAAIELIHMASLVHDDIIDLADSRHGQPSVQAKFGQPQAIAIGVFLYSIALQLIAEVGNNQVLTVISQRVEDLCKGEIAQISERGNFTLSAHAYLDILDNKTAALFKAASVSGAILAGANSNNPDGFEKFGYDLGMLFQLTDDFMDIMSSESDLGKHPGQDLFLEELTVPVMLILQSVSVADRMALLTRIKQKDVTIFPELKRLFIEKELAKEIQNYLHSYIESARTDLKYLPDTPGKSGLLALVGLVADRIGLTAKPS